RDPHDWPALNAWLYSIGVTDSDVKKNFLYSALVNYFPGAKDGSHLVPTEDEINRQMKRLVSDIKSFAPDIVVPIGKLSISYCLDQKISLLSDVIGQEFKVNPYNALDYEVKIIPLPHPSGASTWRHSEKNKSLLTNAL